VVKLLGGRIASALTGLFVLSLGASPASAQDMKALGNIAQAVRSAEVDSSAKPLGTQPAQAATMSRPAIASTATAATSITANAIVSREAAVTPAPTLKQSIATEAAWLYKAGWPLYALVGKYATNAPLDEQTNCLATAVYFEARGESLEGQLAVARVVMNRAASGRYPPDWCGVVKQPAQFSFVRRGAFPYVDTNSSAWQKAEAIAQLAASNIVPSVGSDVLWYHANYVAPNWRRSLQEVQQIGAHIFYRA
jgi:hypothetical protein